MSQDIVKQQIIDTLTLDLHKEISQCSERFDRIKSKLEEARKNVNLSPLYWHTIDRDTTRVVLIKQQLRDLEIMMGFYHVDHRLNPKP